MSTLASPPHSAAVAAPSLQRANTLANVAHKFGGTSMADAARIRHVAELVRGRPETTQVVVVSAMSGVTDTLLGLVNAAAANQPWREKFEALRQRHFDTAAELFADKAGPAQQWLGARFDELAKVLDAIAVLRGAGSGVAEAISGNGEIWSSWLLHALLRSL